MFCLFAFAIEFINICVCYEQKWVGYEYDVFGLRFDLMNSDEIYA